MTFPLDMGHIRRQRLIEEGKIIFPLDMAHICGSCGVEEGKMIFPADMRRFCGIWVAFPGAIPSLGMRAHVPG
jgi:hypothetical protein